MNPYDATNGALCVNFNTMNIIIKNGEEIVSAEEQTPMTDFGKQMVVKRFSQKQIRLGKELKERSPFLRKMMRRFYIPVIFLKSFLI